MCIILCTDSNSVVQGPDMARECEIRSLPAFAFFVNGVEDKSLRLVGSNGKALADRVAAFNAMPSNPK